jgi:glucan phosphorylase
VNAEAGPTVGGNFVRPAASYTDMSPMEGAMKTFDLSIPEVMFIAATRGLGGAGIGLLVGDHLNSQQRRAVGWTLLGIGLLTTVPIAASLISRSGRKLLAD